MHPNTIRNWADAGVLEAIRTSGNQRRFDPDELARHALATGRRISDKGRRRRLQSQSNRERYLTTLAENVSIASRRGAFEDVCRALARASCEGLGGDSSEIYLLHEDEGELAYAGGWEREPGLVEEFQAGHRMRIGDYPDWAAVVAGSDGLVTNVASAAMEAAQRALYDQWNEVSVISVPLRYEGRLIGVMDFTSRDPARLFDDDDLSFAKVVAAQAATALSNASLIDSERARATQMEAVLAIATAVNSAEGLAETLATICREMGTALRADVASYYTWDATAREMTRVARWDRERPGGVAHELGVRFPIDRHTAWAEAARLRRPAVSHDPGDEGGLSLVAIPLLEGDELRGLIAVYSRDAAREFTVDDLTFADAVARQVEIARRNSELFAHAERRGEQLEQVLEATRAMSAALEPDEVVREIVRGFGLSLGVPETTIYDYDAERDELVVRFSLFVRDGRLDREYMGERLSVRELRMFGPTVHDGVALSLTSHSFDRLGPAERAFMDRFATQSWTVVPMIDAGRVVGVLEGCDPEMPREFSRADLHAAEIFAGQAIVAMSRARALASERERAKDLSVLLRATGAMTGALRSDEAMHHVRQTVSSALGFVHVTVYEWDEAAGEIRVLVSDAHRRDGTVVEDYPGTVYLEADEPVMSRVVRQGQPFWTSDVRTDPRLDEHEREDAIEWDSLGLLYVPMAFRGRSVGMIEVALVEPGHSFTGRELTLMEAIANQAAAALVNAQLYDRQRAQAEDLARTAAVRETLVRFGARLRARDTARGVAAEVAGALDDLGLFERGLVLLRDLRSHDYEVVEATGDAGGLIGAAVDEGLVAPLLEPGGRPHPGVRAQRRAERQVLAALGDHVGGSDVLDALGRTLLTPVLDQQGEAVGLVIAVTRPETVAEAAPLVSLISDQAGIAIRAAHRLVDLQRNLDRAWIMNEILTAVGSTLDVAELLQITVRGMRRVADFGRVGFWFLSDEGDRADVSVLDVSDAPPATLGQVALDPDSPVWRAAATARSVWVGAAAAAKLPGMGEPLSALIVPLLAAGRMAGAVVIGSPVADAFDDATAVLFEQLVAPVGAALQNARLYGRIRNMHLSNLQALSTALNVRDRYMQGHAPRVATYTGLLCRKLGYQPEQVEQIERAAYLHDIGRIGVPEHVLEKPDPLTVAEWELIRRHPVVSGDIIKPVFPEEVYLAVRHHHERWDAAGYPDALPLADLPQLVRVLGVVDAYDAMTAQRPFARTRLYPEAVAELRAGAGTQFDPDLVEPFVELLEELDARRAQARATAGEVAREVDWETPGLLGVGTGEPASTTEDDGAGRGAAALLATLRDARCRHPEVARVLVAAPGERGYALVAGAAVDDRALPAPGEPVVVPDAAVDTAPAVLAESNVLQVDASGCWMSGFETIFDAENRVRAVVRADVAVESGVRTGVVLGEEGGTLDAILRQAAARMTRIEEAANTDGLTGLYNHRYFQERLEQELARARQNDERLALLFADLDHFKAFNDRAGHQAGDEALRGLAALLANELRRVDIAARYGGEEFAVILPDTGSWGAQEVAERIRRAVDQTSLGGDRVTISIGVAVFPDDAATGAALIDRADWAMYRAKRRGRNRIEAFAADEGVGSGQLVLEPGDAADWQF